MKKRVIILGSLVFLLAMILLYIISLITITNENKNKAEEEIKIYLSIATDEYNDETKNYAETSAYLLNLDSRLRITFIDLTGQVVYDSTLLYNVSDLDNHLDRQEILHLGEVVIRKSKSTNSKMMYVAALDNTTYIRISFNTIYFTTGTIVYAVVSAISILVLYILAIVVFYFVSRRMLKPIENKINELATLADTDVVFKTDTIDKLPEIIQGLKLLINNKIKQIQDESLKNDTIIQAIDECLILLRNEIVTLVNNNALSLFKVKEENVLGKNYIYLFRNQVLLEAIDTAIKSKEKAVLMLIIEKKTYECRLIPFNSIQLLISLKDISEKEQIEMIKKDFFANASHELKSPLTSIIGYEQMILNGIISDKEEIKEASLKILKEANRMNQIIIDMLELSNLEFSKTYDLKEENLTAILNEVIKSYQAKMNTKHLDLELNLAEVRLNCNRNQMEMLFSNLLDNAIKYNKDNGKIKLTLSNDFFMIEDTGIGIAKEDQTRVFERFYRVDKAKSKEIGGTGLGLAIVKHICEKFSYSYDLESRLNKGTKIIIYFANKYKV